VCGIAIGLLIVVGIISWIWNHFGPTAGWIAIVVGVLIFTPVGGLMLRTQGWQGHPPDREA
jgi:multisubunit Na+/H+ antiporter MnhG subunit